MSVRLNLTSPEITFRLPAGGVISKEQVYEKAGFTAKDDAGNSLMHLVHMGEGGQLDDGILVAQDQTIEIKNYYAQGGKLWDMGKPITVTIEVERPQSVPEPEIVNQEPALAQPSPWAQAAPEPGLDFIFTGTSEDGRTLNYELSFDLGSTPGDKKIPDLKHTFEAPTGKRITGGFIVGYPYAPNGALYETIDITSGGVPFDGDTVEFSVAGTMFDMEFPFGYDAGGMFVQGIWYAVAVTTEDIPAEKPTSAWGMLTPKAEPTPQPEPHPLDPEPQSGLGNIWADSEPTNPQSGDIGLAIPNLDSDDEVVINLDDDETTYRAPAQPAYQQAVTQPQAPPVEPEYQQPPTTDYSYQSEPDSEPDQFDLSDIDLDAEIAQPANGKKPKPAKSKKAKQKSTAKKDKKLMIGSVIAFVLLVTGLGVGGVMYRNAGLKEVQTIRTKIVENNKLLAEFMKIEELTPDDTTEIARITNEQEAIYKEFESKNIFARQEESRLIENTQALIDQLQEKVNQIPNN